MVAVPVPATTDQVTLASDASSGIISALICNVSPFKTVIASPAPVTVIPVTEIGRSYSVGQPKVIARIPIKARINTYLKFLVLLIEILLISRELWREHGVMLLIRSDT
jgi:hypothetical protein